MADFNNLTTAAKVVYYATWEKAIHDGKASWQCSWIENDKDGIPVKLHQLKCRECPFYGQKECEADMMRERTAAEWKELKVGK